MFPHYLHRITSRQGISAPLTIDLTCTYDSLANSGSVEATITNTSGSTVSGLLHFAITESDIPYNWYGLTTVEHVCRDFLPNASGESVSIPAGDTIIRSRPFTISGAWDEHECDIAVFVQGASREIYQGAEIGVMEIPNMDYYGLTFNELSGNGNGVAQAGETIRMYLTGKNNGTGDYTGSASINSSDSYITIQSSTPQVVSVGPGDDDTVIVVDAAIDGSCPSPHTWNFDLIFASGDQDNVDFIITDSPGFTDDIESGQGGWTHSGGNDNWHITEYRSHSPTHSWYCGIESNHQYTNLNDASLISPYFVVTPDSSLTFWHRYSLETNYDYTYVEIDNNSGWWIILDEFNGFMTSWSQETYPLSAYDGQTARLRFRFISDQSVVAEGWYVDDVMIPTIIGINEENGKALPVTLQVSPNPFKGVLSINHTTVGSERQDIYIYDATGRLVKSYPQQHGVISWNGSDEHGNEVPAGIYFVQLVTDKEILTQKALLLK